MTLTERLWERTKDIFMYSLIGVTAGLFAEGLYREYQKNQREIQKAEQSRYGHYKDKDINRKIYKK